MPKFLFVRESQNFHSDVYCVNPLLSSLHLYLVNLSDSQTLLQGTGEAVEAEKACDIQCRFPILLFIIHILRITHNNNG